MKNERLTICLMVMVLAMPAIAHWKVFTLHNDEHLDVTTDLGSPSSLSLYDSSTANILRGRVSSVSTNHNSTLSMSGGYVDGLSADDNSTVNISGGETYQILARDNSTVNISGGSYVSVSSFGVTNSDGIHAMHHSSVIIYGAAFTLKDYLEWDSDGKTVLGIGRLTIHKADGTYSTIKIREQHDTATITAIPEPTTMLLFGIGGLALRRKQR